MNDTQNEQVESGQEMVEPEAGAVRGAAMHRQEDVHDEGDSEGQSAPDSESPSEADGSLPVRDLLEVAPGVDGAAPEETAEGKTYTEAELTEAVRMLTETIIVMNGRIISLGTMIGELRKNDGELAARVEDLKLVLKRTVPAAALLMNTQRKIITPQEAAGNGKPRNIKLSVP